MVHDLMTCKCDDCARIGGVDRLPDCVGEIVRLRAALAFYADEDLYYPIRFEPGPGTVPILKSDRGKIARKALQK